MNKKEIEDMFSVDIEDNSKVNQDEYNELLELGKKLEDKDFSKDSNKEAVFNKALENINKNKGDKIMKKSKKSKRFTTVAASIAVAFTITGTLTQTAFGQSIVEKIVKTINLGHIEATQYDTSGIKSYTLPNELKGKIFDKDGNKVEVITKEKEWNYYTESGEKIYNIQKDGKIITVAENEKEEKAIKENTLIVKDSKKLNDYTSFKVILPSYLPTGYEFEKAEFYKDENGKVENSKYIDVIFKNKETGKEIYMQQREASKETGYETGTDGTMQKVKINGVDAIIQDDSTIDWEVNKTLYGISGKGDISKDDLVKIAESIR